MDTNTRMPRWGRALMLWGVFHLLSRLLIPLFRELPIDKGNMEIWLFSIVLTVLACGVPVLIIRPRIGRTAPQKLVWASAVGITAIGIQTLITGVTAFVLGSSGPEPGPIPSGAPEWVMAIISACIVPGICEEGLFRGAIQESLAERFGRMRAVLLTAALFAAVHMSVVAFPSHFFGSLLLSLTLFHTGSLAACMCQHAFYNLTVMLIDTFPDLWGKPVIFAFYLVWIALLTIPLLRKLRLRRKKDQ